MPRSLSLRCKAALTPPACVRPNSFRHTQATNLDFGCEADLC